MTMVSATDIYKVSRGGSRTATASKMERLVIMVNSWKPLTIITKRSILNVATVLDPPLVRNEPLKPVMKDIIQINNGPYTYFFISNWFINN